MATALSGTARRITVFSFLFALMLLLGGASSCSSPDQDGADADSDCGDTDPQNYPGGAEVCDADVSDHPDNDCDTPVDGGVAGAWYPDLDGDGYGDSSAPPTAGCTRPPGYVADGIDCDDTNRAVHPGVVETCNGVDDDCDGQVDQNLTWTYYQDADGDGYGTTAVQVQACGQPAGFSDYSTDCNDSDASIYPAATEACDGVDNNCDGQIDEGVGGPYYPDEDNDTYGDSSAPPLTSCTKPAGYVTSHTDCDDGDASVYPNAAELCNGRDDDCDGEIDDGGGLLLYADHDGDGHGTQADSAVLCSSTAGYVSTSDDCDDTDPDVYPGAPEICDGKDNDCNPATADMKLFYPDADGDGFGVVGMPAIACTAPSGTAEKTGDCNDQDPTVYPGALELCDGQDNDCNGPADDNLTLHYRDRDGDGFGVASQYSCSPGAGFVPDRGDCDDTSASIHPGATDSSGDGIDSDCGGHDDPDPYVGLGSSPEASIQAALDAASPGATIWVGSGTYLEHDLTFRGKAVTLISTRRAGATVIDANNLGRVFIFSSSEGSGSVLDGFTFTHGLATDKGGGMLITGSSPSIRGCILSSNSAKQGGGAWLEASSATFTDSIFLKNIVKDCTVTSVYQGPVGYAVTTSCRTTLGGGLFATVSSPVLTRCRFEQNQVSGMGGALYYDQVSASAVIKDCVLAGNFADGVCSSYTDYQCDNTYCPTAGEGGGAFMRASSPLISGGAVQDNSTYGVGGGLYLEAGSEPRLDRAQVSNNYADRGQATVACNYSGGPDTYYVEYFGGSGAGLFLYDSDPALSSSVIAANRAAIDGGGLSVYYASPDLDHVAVVGNTVEGACQTESVSCDMSYNWTVSISSCEQTRGGGLYLASSAPRLTSSLLFNNSAHFGGGLFATGSSPVLDSVRVLGNVAPPIPTSYGESCLSADMYTYVAEPGSGGGLYFDHSAPSLSDIRMEANAAQQSCSYFRIYDYWSDGDSYESLNQSCAAGTGGGAYATQSTLSFTNLIAQDNQAADGAGSSLQGGSSALEQVVYTGNRLEPLCSLFTDTMSPDTSSSSCYWNQSGGLSLGGGATGSISSSILAYNMGDELIAPDGILLSAVDLYDTSGELTNGSWTSGVLKLEPGFLTYANGLPTDLHLATSSPLVNAGPAGIKDPDGSSDDLGAYGGSSGDLWDLDGDGFPDWFWPGTIDVAPAGSSPAGFDHDDRDPHVH